MKHTILIEYDKDEQYATIYSPDGGEVLFNWYDYEITHEDPNGDCEDFNDNARWLMKTLLAILKLEKQDPNAHCDWSADYDHFKDTGKYRFHVSIDRIKDEQ